MTNNKNSTRYYSAKQEKHVAKAVNGKRTANSGATAFSKGDISTKYFLIECKTCMDGKRSFSIKKEWLDKNAEEAFAMRKPYNALAFNFGDGTDYFIMDEKTFKLAIKLIEKYEEGE